MNIKALFFLIILLIPSMTFAHPGKTDSSGGHTCHTNCKAYGLNYGEYHYPKGTSDSHNGYLSTDFKPIKEETWWDKYKTYILYGIGSIVIAVFVSIEKEKDE